MILRLLPLIFLWLVVSCSPQNQEEINLIELVPQNTSFVAQINDSISLKSSTVLTKIFSLDDELKKTVRNIMPNNASRPQMFFITPEGKNQNVVGLIFKSTPLDTLTTYNKSINYSGQTIGVFNKGGQEFYAARMGGLKMLSESQLVIENGIRNFQNKQRGISSLAFYQLAESMDEDLAANFLIHPSSLTLTKTFFPGTPLFPVTGRDWIELGLEVSENGFNLNGVALLNDSIPDALTLVKNIKPQQLSLSKVVPANFTSYLGFPIDDMEQLENNFKRLSRQINLSVKETRLSSIVPINEIAWISVESEKSIVLRIDELEESFPPFVNTEGNSKKFRSFNYYKSSIPEDLQALINIFGDPLQPQWGCWYENLLIMSETESGLKNILGNYLDRNTLDQNSAFVGLKEKLADENSFLWIGNTKNLVMHWQQNKGPLKIKDLDVDAYPFAAFQGVAEESFTHLHFSLEKNLLTENKGGVNNAYTLELSSSISTPPQWFNNHRNKGMDVVVQDSDNVLYLFSNTGKLFWKKQLSGPIIGKIHPVDLFKNNRWQLAFRTADRLMVLDRDGKIVRPFDIKLPKSSDPQPLAVFDYDNNRNYRFLIAQDRSLIMYDNRGKRVSGFALKKVNANMVGAPKHIRLQSKDYILIPLENKSLKIVSRTGKDRLQVKGDIAFTENPIFSYLNTFATSDQEGNLVQIDTKGNKVVSALKLAPNHRIDATTKTLVTLSENTLNIRGIPVKLPYGEYSPPKIFYLDNTLFFSTTDKSDQKVYLFYSDGTAVEGFPVYGNSAVDITNSDKDKALEMVVGTEDNSLLIYEIN
jgi:hypothetical protein